MDTLFVGEKLNTVFSQMTPVVRREVEEWVINNVKLAILKKIDLCLGLEGKKNLRQLLLVPIFSIADMTKRVDKSAPELRTLYYKELIQQLISAEQRFCS